MLESNLQGLPPEREMTRKYLTLSAEMHQLRVGAYVIDRAAMVENDETGEAEMLLVITDTRMRGPERTHARYLPAGKHIEIDIGIGFHFFIGASRQVRGVLDLPDDVTVLRMQAPATALSAAPLPAVADVRRPTPHA
jgi:hypothetical protein